MSYEEYPVFVPMGSEHLCAVVCVPAAGLEDVGVILLTGGNYTRSHRNRMWVRAARRLAASGFPSVRLDYRGVGDSTGVARFDMETPFDADAIAAGEFLRRATGVSRLMTVATCFGGRSAIAAAARDANVVGAVVFPMPVTVPPGPTRVRVRTRVRRRLERSPAGRQLVSAVRRRPARQPLVLDRPWHVSPRLVSDLTTFLPRGPVRFVYGELTPSLPELRRCIGKVESLLGPEERARLRVDIVPGTTLHRFQNLRDQDIVVERATGAVAELYASLVQRDPRAAVASGEPV